MHAIWTRGLSCVSQLMMVLCVLVVCGPVTAADPPAALRWNFGAEETTPLVANGDIHRDVPGPRPPEYPDFEVNNTAVRFDGGGVWLSFEDPGAQSIVDFTNGDAITLEAWVQVSDLRNGEYKYIIGKGRTGAPGFARNNQNWALRILGVKGKAGVSFLFATPPSPNGTGTDSHWHRWNSTGGFSPGNGWHHVAVTYTFGNPDSVRAWIDGKPQTGSWDMGGATADAPVVDDDAVWIGSSQGGSAGNSFRGGIDSVVIHRQALGDDVMKTRYRFTGTEVVTKPAPEVMPDPGTLLPGKVVMSFHEGLPTHDRWLNEGERFPAETLRWVADTAFLDRIPLRYDAWGIRENWKAPVLARLATDMTLTPGKHRFLIRVRGLSRLWVNEEVIARSKPLTGSPSGEEPMTLVAEPPVPGARIAEHRQQEVFGEATIASDGRCQVILETIIGGKSFRTDPGELLVAVQNDAGTMFHLLPVDVGHEQESVPLTDEHVTLAAKVQEEEMSRFDDQNRRGAAASQKEFWDQRHEMARSWVAQHPAPAVPSTDEHPIDAFLQARIDQALTESAKTPEAEARQFHSEVLPILRDNCFRCHGEKENGGLRLNSREGLLKHGDSGSVAVLPGHPEDSELLRRVQSDSPDERMPPGAAPLTAEQTAVLTQWIADGARWPARPVTKEDLQPSQALSDLQFLRRAFYDSVGVPPTEDDIREFLQDTAPDKRATVIARLVDDERWADHWMSYWQDVLAESPSLLNASLNTTGPFRWFLYDSLRDRKPFDQLVTELILLRGSKDEGGSAGFGIAADNDAPMAAKGQIVASAFLGIELQCARCHDSPYHSTLQSDLYSLAAMFERKSVTVPKTSRVPAAFFENKDREPLIRATLKPDEPVNPTWPFAEVTGVAEDDALTTLMQKPEDTRERLAALVTSPANQRFAQVVVNRVWRRLMGAGLVEPPHDWEGQQPSHPELLQWLAAEFVAHDYDLRYLSRLIMTSDVYQRAAEGNNLTADPESRFFAAPDRRRLTAEQIVDTLYAASGRSMDLEELTFDPDGRRPSSNRITLGKVRRSWMFASLANERDRPTLNLPRAQAVADILIAFGWTGSRQYPRTDREVEPNVIQPGIMANSVAATLLTRVTSDSELSELARAAASPEQLVDSIFLRYLSRLPTEKERHPLATALAQDFEFRVVPDGDIRSPEPATRLPKVTWSNHLRSEANEIALEIERQARSGPAGDPRLFPGWRETYEDVIWSVMNLREFVWLP
jgi:hypothetical protein